MKTVILYGELAKRFGKTHRLAVRNAREAIRALKANFSDFAPYMGNAHKNGVGFKVFVGGSSLDYSELENPAGSSEIIRIAPVLMGAGGGWFKILIGAVLIVGGAIISGLTFGGAAPIGTAMISGGIGLIFGGISQLLMSPPEVPPGGTGDTINKTSYLFNGPANTAAQGSTIPVLYGKLIVGSCVVSAGIESYEG